ncbi:MAG: LysE family translocator [Chloroflexota bacterium]
MPPIANLPIFLAASLALLLTPGPAVLYIVTRSVDQGRKAGLVSVLGIESGTLFHVFAAALGLSAILLSSALAFDIVKYLGAAYLIYIGVRKLLTPIRVEEVEVTRERNLRRTYSQGAVVALLNPKTALFFLAFLRWPELPETGSSTAPGISVFSATSPGRSISAWDWWRHFRAALKNNWLFRWAFHRAINA